MATNEKKESEEYILEQDTELRFEIEKKDTKVTVEVK